MGRDVNSLYGLRSPHEEVRSTQDDLGKSNIFWGSEKLLSSGVPEQITDNLRFMKGLCPDKLMR